MSFTTSSATNEQLAQEAEQLHEYFVDQLGYATYDVDIVATEDTLEITVSPGAAAPPDWPADVLDAYCSRSKRERRRLVERYCFPERICDELERMIDEG